MKYFSTKAAHRNLRESGVYCRAAVLGSVLPIKTKQQVYFPSLASNFASFYKSQGALCPRGNNSGLLMVMMICLLPNQ